MDDTKQGRGDVDWLLGLVAAPSAAMRADPTGRDVMLAVPSARRPQLLVPGHPRRVAAASVQDRDFGVGPRRRVARRALSLALRAGVAQHLLGACFDLSGPVAGEGSLLDHLREVLGRDDLHGAIRVGRRRPNGKPLVALFDLRGRPVGYAKVAWNDVTRDLLGAEAETLAWLARGPGEPRTFAAPRVLHHGAWRDGEVLVVSALPVTRWQRRRHVGATVDAMREIAELGPRSEEALAGSPYWEAQRVRLGASTSDRLHAVVEEVERREGDRRLAFAAAHGDWTPWNVGALGGRLAVWDWERHARRAPLWSDAAHFDFHLAMASGRPALKALDDVLGGGTLLRHLGLTRSDARSLLALDLVEMCLRHDEGGRAGADASPQLLVLEHLFRRSLRFP